MTRFTRTSSLSCALPLLSFFFFFNDTATTEIYTFPYTTLFRSPLAPVPRFIAFAAIAFSASFSSVRRTSSRSNSFWRSEEHTSELQSRLHLVCRLLLEKKKVGAVDHPMVV